MVCELYGQVDIELSGTEEVEVVLEGQLEAVQLKGQIDIALESAKNIYLGSIMNDPNINASISTTLNLAACLKTDNTYINAIAKPCCDNLDAIIVQVLEVSQPTISTLQNNYSGQGFIYNGDCYQFTSIGGAGSPVTTVLPEDYLSENCTNSICPECPSPTPSLTTSVTQTPSISVTPTPSITQTPSISLSPTPSITQTPSNTVTPSITLTPSISTTPTPSVTTTPSTTPQCTNCDQYLITNNDKGNTLTISYVECNTGNSQLTTINPEGSKQLCSCSAPSRVGGSTDFTVVNQGDCGTIISNTPTPTVTTTPTTTPTPSPTQPRGPEGCYLHNVKTSVSEPDVCDGTASSQDLYFPYANDIREGDTVYTNSSCSSTLQSGRFVEDKYNSEPPGYIFEVSVGGTLVAYLCS